MAISLNWAEPIVVDSSVIVASYIPGEPNHSLGVEYMDGLDRGDYIFHLPMLVVVEVSAAIRRRVRRWQRPYNKWQLDLARWEREGRVFLYPMNQERMEHSVVTALNHSLRGADSVVAALAEELNMPLRTFDNEHLERWPGASR